MKANNMPWITACRGTAAALMPVYRAQRDRMLKVRFWGQEWAGTRERHSRLTNRSSFHRNHHSWTLPFSSKNLEMGHTEKMLSKESWRHRSKMWAEREEEQHGEERWQNRVVKKSKSNSTYLNITFSFKKCCRKNCFVSSFVSDTFKNTHIWTEARQTKTYSRVTGVRGEDSPTCEKANK